MKKIIFTGPESSGKTTLCEHLAKHYQLPHVVEFARTYLETVPKYQYEDLGIIAQNQHAQEVAYCLNHTDQPFLLCDTDLITIKVWSEFKYRRCDPYILNIIEGYRYDNRFYFLCAPDIPWQADPQREHPHLRQQLFDIYEHTLKVLGLDYEVVGGSLETRMGLVGRVLT
jgi:nicotinamide riboside kinase